MDRRDYFKDYYKTHAEDKKRKRRERYAQEKLVKKWGLFAILYGGIKEERIKTYCGKHRKDAKKLIKHMGMLLIKPSIRPTEEGECDSCNFERIMKGKWSKRGVKV